MIQNEQENEQHNEIHTKDWFGPALASMARLNQIQANVHNMGFHTVSSLKAHRSVKHRTKPPLPHNAAWTPQQEEDASQPHNESEIQKDVMVNYTDLESSPPLSTASYQRTAWGSNHSIPELVAQQGQRMTKLRPSSAKGQVGKLKLHSRSRPQSAKEPLCSDRDEKRGGNIAVCGRKKNLSNTRPPSRGSIPSPNVATPTNNGAWAGLPPGHVIDAVRQAQDDEVASPMVPPSSPVPGEELRDELIDSSRQTPPLLRRPLPQPIHLSLPSVADSVDAMQDGRQPTQDDIDTQRLLVQADLFVDQQKVKEKEQGESVKNLLARNTTLPDQNDIDGDSAAYSPDRNDNKGIRINVSDKSQPNNSPHSRNKQKSSMFLTPDDDIENCYQPLTLVEESRNDKTRVKSAPVRSNREKMNIASKAGVKIREDRNVTVDITPRNIGRRVNDVSTLSSRQRLNKSNKQDVHVSDKKSDRVQNAVSVVGIDYPMDDSDKSNFKDGNVKGRKIKSMNEVETMVSQLSKLSSMDDDTESVNDSEISWTSQMLHKSEGEKNYYEISRSQSRQSVSSMTSDPPKTSEKEASVLYKTTKTIEFDKETLKENSTKMAITINSQITPKPRANVKQKQSNQSSTLLPSTIKQQKTVENHHKRNGGGDGPSENVAKAIIRKEEKESGIDELTTMLMEAKTMAVNSLYDASRRPPSGKKKVQRPSSAPSDQKPKPRPSSVKTHNVNVVNKEKKGNLEKPTKSYPSFISKTGSSNCCRSHKSVRPSKPVVIKSIRPSIPFETPESDHCRKVQSRMAQLGVDVDPRVLEKALYAPAGESLYYEVPGNLPKNPTEGLLSHYKYWLPEDYKRIQLMEKRLAQDDHLRFLEKLAAEKKAKKAAEKESKGKKKKKRKLERSNSIV